jgi:uncharacterized FlaG/YvyC family protein
MQIKLPDALLTPESRNGPPLNRLPGEIPLGKSNAAFSSPLEAVNDASGVETPMEEDYELLVTQMDQAADLLSLFDRELKYEVLEGAGVVQLQVIDAHDGRVVRKVPADEVIKFILAMKEKIDDRVDVWA